MLGHQLQDAQVRVGLHRVADQGLDLGEGVLKGLELTDEGGRRVDVKRRAEPLGQLGGGHVFAVQFGVAVVEGFHGKRFFRVP